MSEIVPPQSVEELPVTANELTPIDPFKDIVRQFKELECALSKSPQDTATLQSLLQQALALNNEAYALHNSGRAGMYTEIVNVMCAILVHIINRLLGLIQRSELIKTPEAQLQDGGPIPQP